MWLSLVTTAGVVVRCIAWGCTSKAAVNSISVLVSIMMYTVKQVAEMLQVGTDLVNQFVMNGELVAIDVSLTRGKKKILRIPDDALRQFLEQRRIYVPPPRSRKGCRPRPREVIDFFAPMTLQENGRRRLTISDVAEHLGITGDHVRQLIAYGHLTAVNAGGTSRINRYRIAEKELFAFIERSKSEPKLQRAARLRGPDFLDNLETRKCDSACEDQQDGVR